MTHSETIRAQDISPHMDPKQGIILDVRTRMEHAEKHMGMDHVHVPLDELNPTEFMKYHDLHQDSHVYILCRSGKRASQAAEKFASEGYHNVKVIAGGIIACEDCGHAIQSNACGTAPIPLERQVRIAAGLIIASGAALGILINPLFTVIPLFVGCGLVFAGITDRCGMALLLTKAPWNTHINTPSQV